MKVLARLRDSTEGLPHTQEALSDALITVYGALQTDRLMVERKLTTHKTTETRH